MRLRPVLASAAIAAATTVGLSAVSASSHREAPFIAKNPKDDGTDFYAFMSYESGRGCVGTTTGPCGYVTLIANYVPLEDAAGGPNFFTMDPDALYEIEIDNTGDGVEDLTFSFQFTSTLTGVTLPIGPTGNTKNVAIPFAYVGGTNAGHGFGDIGSGGSGIENVTETYGINLIKGPRRTGSSTPITSTGGSATFSKPVDNVGPNTVAPYDAYANTFIQQFDIPGCTPAHVAAGTHSRVFVGQRQEGFAVNLGEVFDTVHFTAGSTPAGGSNSGTGPTQNLADVIGLQDQGLNDIATKNVQTIAIEVPAECIASPTTNVFGAWTTSSVRQARVINPTATFSEPTREGGPYVQISRLGMPLVNEVIIGLPDKDAFNESEPSGDTQWATYITNPTLPAVLQALFGGAGVTAPTVSRADLVAGFAQGLAFTDPTLGAVNINQITQTSPAVAEMLRLNTNLGGLMLAPTPATTTAPTSGWPVATAGQNPLGAIGCFDNPTATAGTLATLDVTKNPDCDPFGFPNGRRPGDDVVDIELRVAMGSLLDTTDAPTGGCMHWVGQKNTASVATGPTAVDTLGPGNCLPLSDGASKNSSAFKTVFPYLNAPTGAL